MKRNIRQAFSGLLLFCGLMTGFTSCKKDKDSSPGPTPGAAQLLRVTNGAESMQFTYDNSGKVVKLTVKNDLNTDGELVEYTVAYENNRIKTLSSAFEVIKPVYANNRMTHAEVFMGNQKVAYTSYTYQGDVLKLATIYTQVEENDYMPIFGFDFEHDANGNVKETIAMVASQTPGNMRRAGHVAYQYDNKSNPLYQHRDLLMLFWQSVSKNNVVVENHFDENQVPEDRYSYDITYKANGLPEKAVVTVGLPGQPQTTTDMVFTYK